MWPPPIVTPFDDFVTTTGSAATLYASDGVSGAVATFVAVSNARYIPMLGTARGDLVTAQFLSTVSPVAGQVLNIPSLAGGWYIVVKPEQRSFGPTVNVGSQAACLSLPYTLSAQGNATPLLPAQLNSYGEPISVDAQGRSVVASERTYTIRCGISNDFDPLSNDPAGYVPGGITTIYCPLGVAARKGDQVILPSGLPAQIQQNDILYADGVAYAMRLMLDLSEGEGIAPGP